MDHEAKGLDNPVVVSRIRTGFYVLCGIVLLLDLVVTRKVYHPFENLPGFYPLYGFVGCVVLVLIASGMRKFLMRDEDYYDDELKGEAAESQEEIANGVSHHD